MEPRAQGSPWAGRTPCLSSLIFSLRAADLESEVARLREKIHHLDDMLKSQQRKVRQMIEQVRGPASPAAGCPGCPGCPGPGARPRRPALSLVTLSRPPAVLLSPGTVA